MLLDALVQFVTTALVVFSLVVTCLVLLSVRSLPSRQPEDERRAAGNARG